MLLNEDLPSDNIYAYALSKTLIKVASPATVGLYSSCPKRINMILRHVEVHMEQEAARREKKNNKGASEPRSSKPSLGGLLLLIWRLLFFRPVLTEENQRRQNVRFLYVRFSAWHFLGSDLLWAGLTMRLCQSLQERFGKLQLGLYRVVQYDEQEEFRKKAEVEDSLHQWRSKKICCCPLWFLILILILAVGAVLALLLTLGFPQVEEVGGAGEVGEGGDGQGGGAGVLEGLAIAALGVPAVGVIRFLFLMGKNLVFNQDLKIRRGMDDEKLSSKLGFMNEVRKEMSLLSMFVRFMEVFERRRIRVVLEITDLDRCEPRKIVGVLDAINILLSEEDSPFISLLAVNPEVLVQQVNFADSCFCKEDRGYAFLNRIVTLAFTVPPLCGSSKRRVFYNIVSGQSEITEEVEMKASESRALGGAKTSLVSDASSVERAQTNIPLIDKNDMEDRHLASELGDEEMEKLVQSCFDSILVHGRSRLHRYLSGDTMSMRRVINSTRVTVVIMEALRQELPSPERIAAWVVLANHWPCRLSWVLQCLEDRQQRALIDNGDSDTAADDSQTLWELYTVSRAELYVMREQIEELLEQDGDPEMFEMFLKVDFRFTVRDAERFQLSMVNLDISIRKELARIRGAASLKDHGWSKNLAPLPIGTIINMTMEDICKELDNLNFPEKYADIVRSNNLSGQTLVFGDTNDLKLLLQMTYGEWTTFRLHFLSAGQKVNTQSKAQRLPPQHIMHSLSRQQLLPSHHTSTLSLTVP
ncbi:NTPase KAP family P-loop domain-containing protein 1 [Osmerus eperlanus]|uniref:NTPase KAP family P-loop domain-containing protein 1 n=1 Tax=Osmerus eperlanus TaxID=29151 RepID=UPI002E15E34D